MARYVRDNQSAYLSLMKRLLALLALTGALFSGQADAKNHRSFEEVKADRLQKIDELRDCTANASNFEELRACRPMPYRS